MIITTEKGTIISDEGKILTDGITFGLEYKLAEDRNIDEFIEISLQEYEDMQEVREDEIY